MRHRSVFALMGLAALGATGAPSGTGTGAVSAPLSREAQNALVNDYCSGCHSEKTAKGGLVLEGFDAASPFLGAELLEKLILKVRTGMMPPSSSSNQPEPALRMAFVETLEARGDASVARSPDPGWRPFQRLNRAEYARAVRDLLSVEIDAAAFLPPDTVSAGFDNLADVQTVSPAWVSAALRGGGIVSRLAVGSKGEDTPARRAVFSCYPKTGAEESSCAAAIVQRLVDAAYRGRANAEDAAAAMSFYRQARETGSFDDGVRLALQSILTNPKFLFRTEAPKGGSDATSNALSDTAIASRLSFFLWSSAPDAALVKSAQRGLLRTRAGLAIEVKRMLKDPKSQALATRFATQWLRLQDLDRFTPDPARFPNFDQALASDMRRETELFVADLFRSDRSVLDLITSERSFLNERLASHYGVSGVKGEALQSVTLPPSRRGLLGQGSILALTSLADRTSPVLRGKWVLDVLLGTPPPPPPPNVPALDDSVKSTRGGVALSTRERVEEHRRNPACASCHKTIDPPGLALEGYDATGASRRDDNGVPVDVTSELFDGRSIDGPAGLREALLAHQDQVLRNFTIQLMTYATGRRLGPRDMPAVRAIVRAAASEQNRFSWFVIGVVTSDAFRLSKPGSPW